MTTVAVVETHFARARQETDLLRACGHSRDAWNAADEAEASGANREELTALRLRLLEWGMFQWLPKMISFAGQLRDDDERSDLYRGLANVVRAGTGWYEREVERGGIVDPDLALVIAEADDWVEGLTLAQHAVAIA